MSAGQDTRSIGIALGAYVGLFALQLGTYIITSFQILFAQALEVLSDIVVSAFLLLSLWWSKRPPDAVHMFGHGRAQNVAALVASAVMVLFMGLEALRGAIPLFWTSPPPPGAGDTTLALLVLLASMAVLTVPLLAVQRVQEKGASVRAQRLQILKDEVAYVPGLLGVLLVSWGYPLADPGAAVVIAAVILFSGAYLFRDNVEYLVGKSPGPDFLARVATAATSVTGVLRVRDLRAEYVGPGVVQAAFHIEVAAGIPVETASRIVKAVEASVTRAVVGCEYCVIQVDAAK